LKILLEFEEIHAAYQNIRNLPHRRGWMKQTAAE